MACATWQSVRTLADAQARIWWGAQTQLNQTLDNKHGEAKIKILAFVRQARQRLCDDLKSTLMEAQIEQDKPTEYGNLLLAIAEGTKGSVGPAEAAAKLAKYNWETCKKALESLDQRVGNMKESDNHLQFVKQKLAKVTESNATMAAQAERRIDESLDRYADLVPRLAHDIAAGLRDTEQAYMKVMLQLKQDELGDLRKLQQLAESINGKVPVRTLTLENERQKTIVKIQVILDAAAVLERARRE